MRHPASRFAFTQSPEIEALAEGHSNKMVLLFVDGQDYKVSEVFAKTLCAHRQVALEALIDIASSSEQDFIVNLYNAGKLYLH